MCIRLDENIDIEAEEILIAVLPHLIINPEWIQTPAIKGGLNSEGIFTLVQSSKKCANSLSYYVAHHKPTTNPESTNVQILNFFVYFIFKVAVEKRRSTLDHPRISFWVVKLWYILFVRKKSWFIDSGMVAGTWRKFAHFLRGRDCIIHDISGTLFTNRFFMLFGVETF